MMARKANDVELIISAKNESEKAFKDVADALKEIETAAKKGGGLSTLFQGFEARLAAVSARQKEFNKLISDAKGVQKAIQTAEKFTQAVKQQEAALASAQGQLSDLESTYADVEKAANAARVPSERLTKSLVEQESRQASLAETITKTRQEIERSNAALVQNAGLDEKAAAAVTKQRQAVNAAGQAWRDTTQAISTARKEIASLGAQRTNLSAAIATSGGNRSNLEAELRTLKEFIRESQKLNRTGDAGEATKALSRNARERLVEVESLLKAERQLQASLNNDLSKTNAAIRRQEQAFEKLTGKAGAQKKVYDDLKKSLSQFEAVARGEGTDRQQKNIDRLNTTLERLQQNYQETSDKVAATSTAITNAAKPDPRAVAQFEALRQKIEGAREAVQREQVELDKLNQQLREAGVSTDSLAQRQKELDSVTERLTAEEARLTQELKEMEGQAKRTGNGVKQIGSNFLQLGNDTRQSLSYLQRIRGELLSIAATYTGLYAVGGAIRSIYDASVQLNRAEARLGSVFEGDQAKIAEEIAFVRKEADRLKISFEVALDQYTKFITSIPKGSIPLEQIRFTFSGVAEAARVAGLSNDDLQGVFNALTQIASKGTLSLEELRQQLGDRLPGALERTARGLGVTTNELIKLVSEGKVGSEAIVLLSNELKKDFGPQVSKSLQSANASLADFQNTIFDLRLELANSGFIDTLVEGLREATKAIKSEEFKRGAKEFANLLGQIVKVGISLIQNFDKVKTVIELVFAAKVVGLVNTFRLGIVGAAEGLAAFGVQLATILPRIGGVTALLGTLIAKLTSIPVLLAGAGGFGIGKWLYEEFGIVRKVAAGIIGYLDALIKSTKAAFDKVKAYITLSGEERSKRLAEIEGQLSKDIGQIVSVVQDTFSAIDSGIDKEKPKILDPEQTKKDAEEIKNIVDQLTKEQEAILRNAALNGSSEAEQTKLENLRQRIRDALAAIDSEIQQKSADTLEQRLAGIRGEYVKLLRQIEQAGGAGQFPGAASSIDQIVAIKQVEETEKEINRLIQERRQLISSINEQAELGAITVEEATKRINAENARLIPQMNAALQQARQIAGSINSAPITQSVNAQAELVSLEQQRAKKEQLLALEEQINRVMSLRAERIQTINALVDVGTITETEGRRQILDLNRQTNDELAKIIEQAMTMAQTLGDQQLIERLKQVNIELSQVNEQIVTAAQINEQFASGLTNAIDGFIQGTQSAGDALRQFFADMLRWLARAIIQWTILKAIQNSGFGGAVSGAVNAGVNHTGGVVGQTASRRRVPVAAFAGAVRYHSGGIAGLKSNEVPTILEKGEEVITRNDPRHTANGGASGSSPLQVKIVNAIDSQSVLKEALSSQAGQKVLVNAIQANKSSVKSVLS